ncbi:MAG: hypothetical protein WBD22_11020 [Pyrinomonadaceae bacterium]
MKKFSFIMFAIFAFAFILSVDSFAQGNGKRGPAATNQRQQNQRHRIGNGVRSGELTGKETFRLVKEQNQIRRMEDRFRESGDGLNVSERLRLQAELRQSSRHIYKQKHDQQDRPTP